MERTLVALALSSIATCFGQAHQALQPGATGGARAHGDTFWGDSNRGWHFYEDPEPDPEPEALKPPHAKPPQIAPKATPEARPPELAEFKDMQVRLDELRQIAIVRPTEANVRRYMEFEVRVVKQASYFSDVAQRIAWATPDLDMTLQGRPVNAQALTVFDRDRMSSRADTVGVLGKDHALFFFFRSDCPYCHAFAPTLAAFQARYGIPVVPISLDGGTLPEFPNARADNGIARTLRVSQVPALFLAEPFTGKITPLGFGVLSETQLLERIDAVSSPQADQMTPSIRRQISLQ